MVKSRHGHGHHTSRQWPVIAGNGTSPKTPTLNPISPKPLSGLVLGSGPGSQFLFYKSTAGESKEGSELRDFDTSLRSHLRRFFFEGKKELSTTSQKSYSAPSAASRRCGQKPCLCLRRLLASVLPDQQRNPFALRWRGLSH